jgi:hypothetical protein
LFSPCRRRLFFKLTFFFGSLAPLLDVLLFQDRPFNVAGSFDVFRNGSFACDLFNRSRSKFVPGRLGDGINLRAHVNDNLFACTVKITRLMSEIDTHYTSAVDDGLVIHDEQVGAYRAVENTDFYKDKLRRSENHATRS